VMLKNLAAGLQKSGATEQALNALAKAADLTGIPQQVPGALSLPTTVIPGGAMGMSSGPASYRVVSGDIPGAIAKRFSIGISALAKANGSKSSAIMGGKIQVGQVLNLPPGVVDKGPASHANGVAS